MKGEMLPAEVESRWYCGSDDTLECPKHSS